VLRGIQMNLASYACDPLHTRGRRFDEPKALTRTDFQRDRDRIVHCTAFRRLVYKTQVFLNHEGDLFRTRMTHSLEVAQLGRSIARSLRLNEDLVEAVALAHDLGHTPFGHAGQDTLNDCMKPYGGFEHNLQSLRVVDHLEERYPEFNGLNLCFETREGILKHCSHLNALALEVDESRYGQTGGSVGQRFLTRTQPSLEAQLCNMADEIAYNAHDIDDGVRSGLITMEQLSEVPLFEDFRCLAVASHPQLAESSQARRLLYESIRLMLSAQVLNVIETTQLGIDRLGPKNVDEVRALPALVSFDADMQKKSTNLKAFLSHHLYRHAQVVDKMNLAKQMVRDLFGVYSDNPLEMQVGFAARCANLDRTTAQQTATLQRVVADYIAGMTDRFATREHERLTGQRLLSS
jgi:dGTPase